MRYKRQLDVYLAFKVPSTNPCHEMKLDNVNKYQLSDHVGTYAEL
jgi:hypothetical protein